MKSHYVLKNKRRFYTIIITLSVFIATVFFASTAYGYEGKRYDNVTVKKGDTLWTIAGKYCKQGDVRRYIFEIKKANNLDTSVIYEGDELRIPLK